MKTELRLDYVLSLGLTFGDLEQELTARIKDSTNVIVHGFCNRKNTGVQPVKDNIPVIVECFFNSSDFGEREVMAGTIDWSNRTTYKSWRPDINGLIEIQIEHDKQLNDVTVNTDEKHNESVSAFDTQVGGDHYKTLGIQPLELVYSNLGYEAFKGACYVKINKYTTRKKDNEVEQLKKARHILDMWIEKAGEQ